MTTKVKEVQIKSDRRTGRSLACPICGKTGFKSKAGVEGHRKIVHGIDKRKTYPDGLGKKLEVLERNVSEIVKILKVITDRAKQDRQYIARYIANLSLSKVLKDLYFRGEQLGLSVDQIARFIDIEDLGPLASAIGTSDYWKLLDEKQEKMGKLYK